MTPAEPGPNEESQAQPRKTDSAPAERLSHLFDDLEDDSTEEDW